MHLPTRVFAHLLVALSAVARARRLNGPLIRVVRGLGGGCGRGIVHRRDICRRSVLDEEKCWQFTQPESNILI